METWYLFAYGVGLKACSIIPVRVKSYDEKAVIREDGRRIPRRKHYIIEPTFSACQQRAMEWLNDVRERHLGIVKDAIQARWRIACATGDVGQSVHQHMEV